VKNASLGKNITRRIKALIFTRNIVYKVYTVGMRKAARAIVINGDRMLVMHRNKYGNKYFTLVGGGVKDEETLEQGLIRELREETGLIVTNALPVFYEEHPAPHNEQYIYLCEVEAFDTVKVQEDSEEAYMNRFDANIHTPMWVHVGSFEGLEFRTPQLQIAITHALKKGFPKKPVKLS
jgi:ADP-ribose pyrophosphatase YjhB (NUDIX family)